MLFRSDRKSTRLNSSHTLISYALPIRSEEHTSELQSHSHLVCRLLLEKKKNKNRSRETANSDTVHKHKGTLTLLQSTFHHSLLTTSVLLPSCFSSSFLFFFF